MKSAWLLLPLFALTVSTYADAQAVRIADVVSDPAAYLGKRIVIQGSFLFAEPIRESFTINQNGSKIEVFYYDLPGSDKQFILSQQNYSKTELTVSGIMQQYTNSAGSYFMKATSLRFERNTSPDPPGLTPVSYEEILSNPEKYLKKPVTMKGYFLYNEPVRQSFSFDQAGNIIEVLISDLSKIDREYILGQKKYSKKSLVVTGVLQTYVNSKNKYYINAYSVSLEN